MLPFGRHVVSLLLITSVSSVGAATFELNFQPVNPVEFRGGVLESNCNRPGQQINCGNQSGGHADTVTPFFNEVLDTDSGKFYHSIIGLPGEEFVQETFIGLGPRNWQGGLGTASAGELIANRDPLNSDPSVSGSGTANVTLTLVRQVIGDMDSSGSCIAAAAVCQQFIKDAFTMKPLIDQRYNMPNEMLLVFMNDMRNKSLTDRTAIDPSRNTNMLELKGPDAPGNEAPTGPLGGDGDFDIHVNGQKVRVTAGAYTFTPGSFNNGANGTWTYYADGPAAAPTFGFDPITHQINWEAFFDPTQNPAWSYPENQP